MTSVGIMASAVHIPVVGPCTDVLSESFDALTEWSSSTATFTLIAAGRNGIGGQATGVSGRATYQIPSALQSDTITVGVAFKVASLTVNQSIVRFLDNAGQQVGELGVNTSGAIFGSNAAGSVPTGGSSATGLVVVGTWYYAEIKYVMGDAGVGTFTINLDGATVVPAVASVDTKLTGTAYDSIQLGPPNASSGGTVTYDDLYISVGSGCSFKGSQVVPSEATDILMEPFNNFGSWVQASTPLIQLAGRTGSAAELNSISDALSYNIPASLQNNVLTLGFAWRWTDANTGIQRPVIDLYGDGGTIRHARLLVTTSTKSISVTNDTVSQATSAADAVAGPSVWNYIEWEVKLADSPDGYAKVRVNGVEVINITGRDFRNNAGVGTVFDQIRLPNTSGQVSHFDDFYAVKGTGFKGDQIIFGPLIPTVVGTPNHVSHNGTLPPLLTFPDPPRIDGDYQIVLLGSQSSTETADATNDAGMVRIGAPFAAASAAARFMGVYGLAVPSDASGPTTVQFTRQGGAAGARTILEALTVRGVNQTSPVAAASASVATLSTNTVTIPSLTVPVDNTLGIAFFSATWPTGPAATVATPPSSWTLVGSYQEPVGGDTTVSRNTVHVYMRRFATTGSTGACSAVFTATPSAAGGQMILLRP